MSTNVRPEVSQKNPYYLERERYYELKHFCRQYHIWKKAYAALDGLSKRPADLELFVRPNKTGDPTARCAEARASYGTKIEMVEKCAKEGRSFTKFYTWEQLVLKVAYTNLMDKLFDPVDPVRSLVKLIDQMLRQTESDGGSW